MKKWIWAVLIFLVAGVVGGYAVAHYHEEQVQYERNITNGKTAIDQTNYTAAKNYFSRAITIRKDDQQAANLLAQTKMYMRASSEFKSNEFTSARGDYQTVLTYKKASATLKQRSETKVKLIDKIKQNVKKFNKKLTTAKQKNEAWDFYGSNAIIDGLLSDKEFSKEYYKTIYDQALVLQRFNNAGIVADQNSFNTDTTPDNNENSMESGSGQQGLPRYGGQFRHLQLCQIKRFLVSKIVVKALLKKQLSLMQKSHPAVVQRRTVLLKKMNRLVVRLKLNPLRQNQGQPKMKIFL
ncbi:hypothetical protein ACF0HX_03725 [Pediococcus pentosaceus]